MRGFLKIFVYLSNIMKIGIVGTGKLGLPVSFYYATKGHDIYCYDINPNFYVDPYRNINKIHNEELSPNLDESLINWLMKYESLSHKFTDLETIVNECDLIFVAIQTPHNKEYEGITRLPEERIDFDYTYLINGIQQLTVVANKLQKNIPVIIISTVLPGTIRREILPLLSKYIKLCYNPYFIAMGTVAKDCQDPEFILLGNHDHNTSQLVTDFYKTICSAPVFSTTIENAELIKVCYNTFISTKIAMANTIMEIAHYCPNTNCDTVIDALSLATNRLISPTYLRGGMGDGGGCHPRDNIALSWLSKKLGLQYDWFESIMLAREKQTDFLANLIIENHNKYNLPIFILGESFKKNTAIKTGSPAILLENILTEKNIPFFSSDPYFTKDIPKEKGIYFIGCCHDIFNSYTLPEGSILIDPFRKYNSLLTTGVYIPVGIGSTPKD